ncbi:MAG: cyclic nucleotide-binding domain-containing protein [Verrucomicrobiales bacterium]
MKELAYIHDEGEIPESLQNIPFLKSFTQTDLDDILNSSSIIECEPGDVILSEGMDAHRMFILLTGTLEITKEDEHIAEFSGTGHLFGELAALEDESRSATVVAKDKVYCLAIDHKFLEDIRPKEQNPAFYAALYGFIAKVMAERLKRTSEEYSRLERDYHDLLAKCGEDAAV